MEPKFKIGDKVKFHKDNDSEAGEIISFSYDPTLETFRYVLGVKQLNLEEQRFDEAVKHCLEDELVEEGTEPIKDEVEEPKKEKENE